MTGDISDWRLIGEISRYGLVAYLKNSVDPTAEVEKIVDEHWDVDDEMILQRIESVVYDHPQMLDDFSADLAIVADRSVWVPRADQQEDDETAWRQFDRIYHADEEDVMTDEVGDLVCAYMLVPGLEAFLQRTFPGARRHCHLSVLARRFGERTADLPRLYVEVRRGETDFLLFDGAKMLLASTLPWHDKEDIKYHIFNILNVYGINPQEVEVSVSGLREVKTELVKSLREMITYVMMTMLPASSGKKDMPITVSLLSRV